MSQANDLIARFVVQYGLRVISDGDLDGIFACGILLRGLNRKNIKAVSFPHPSKLHGLKVKNSILIEMPLTRGVLYLGSNILIDHHPEPPRVELFEGSTLKERIVIENVKSVASLVYSIYRDSLELPRIAEKILSAVDNVDNGVYVNDIDRDIHYAYLINKTNENMRYQLLEMIINNKWFDILDWIRSESKKYKEYVPKKVDELVDRAIEIYPGVALFCYDIDDKIESAAMGNAMFKLEEKYKIVIGLGTKNNKPEKARIATKKNMNLKPLYSFFISLGFSSGGRKNVGGVQFLGKIDSTEEAKKIFTTAIQKIEKQLAPQA